MLQKQKQNCSFAFAFEKLRPYRLQNSYFAKARFCRLQNWTSVLQACKTEFKWSSTSHNWCRCVIQSSIIPSSRPILPSPATSSSTTTPKIVCVVDVINAIKSRLKKCLWVKRRQMPSPQRRIRSHPQPWYAVFGIWSFRCWTREAMFGCLLTAASQVYLQYFFITTAGDEWIAGSFPDITDCLTSLDEDLS